MEGSSLLLPHWSLLRECNFEAFGVPGWEIHGARTFFYQEMGASGERHSEQLLAHHMLHAVTPLGIQVVLLRSEEHKSPGTCTLGTVCLKMRGAWKHLRNIHSPSRP